MGDVILNVIRKLVLKLLSISNWEIYLNFFLILKKF